MGLRAAALLAACLACLALACTGGDEANGSDAAAAPTLATPPPAAGSAAATVATATPTVAAPPVDGPYGGVMVLANRGDPPSGFDMLRTSSIALHHVGGAIFGPGNLVMRCRENLYLACPYLATNWTVDPSQTEWTFTLRDDALWHDGTPFTAADAALWFELAVNGYESDGEVRAPAYFKGDLGAIESVEALPGNRLRVVLGERNRFFLDVLANPRLKLAHPEHLVAPELESGDLSVSPLDIGLVGLGPFRFEDYDRGTRVRVRRFDGYFERDGGGRAMPYLDGIDYVIIREPAAMDAAFRSGRLDGGARGFGHYLTVERQRGYDADLGDGVYYAEMEGGMFRLAFNVLKEGPWQDPRVRRAVSLWVDRDAAIPVALGGFGWTTPSLGPPNRFKDKAYVVWPTFDREPLSERRAEAKQLMADAGYADGFAMGHLCRARQTAGCQLLQAQLRELGVDLRIQVVDEGEWNRARTSLDFDSQQGRLSVLPIPEGTEGVYGTYSRSPDSYAKHEDPRVSELYRLLRAATLPERRLEVWRQLQRYIFVEQTYVVAIAEAIYVAPYRGHVRGLVAPPEDGHTHTDFSTVWLER